MSRAREAPTFFTVNQNIVKGFSLVEQNHPIGARDALYEAWLQMVTMIDECNLGSVKEFDKRFRGRITGCELIREVDSLLCEEGEPTPGMVPEHLAFCETVLERFYTDLDEYGREDIRTSTMECCFRLKDGVKAEQRYNQFLLEDDNWESKFYNWLGYYLEVMFDSEADLRNAEEIITNSSVIGGSKKDEWVKSIREILAEHSDTTPYPTIMTNNSTQQSLSNFFSRVDPGYLEVLREFQSRPETVSTGRREPCTCGSGKKYKNCCERSLRI